MPYSPIYCGTAIHGFTIKGLSIRLQASFDFAGSPDNRKPSDLDGRGVDTRVCISPKRTHPLPRIGDRYGLLTIIDCEYGERGAVRRALVQCGCGSEPYWTTYRVLVRVGRPDVVQGCMECKYKKLREKSLAKSVRYAVGDRVGEFTVLAIERRFSGKRACNEYLLQCSCGSKPLHKTHKDLDRNKYQCCQRCWSALAVKDRKPWSPTRYKRYDEGVIPNVGDVIGLSTVLEVTFGTWGGFEEMLVQCKCGSAPRKVYNIRKFRECKTKACSIAPNRAYWRDGWKSAGYCTTLPVKKSTITTVSAGCLTTSRIGPATRNPTTTNTMASAAFRWTQRGALIPFYLWPTL